MQREANDERGNYQFLESCFGNRVSLDVVGERVTGTYPVSAKGELVPGVSHLDAQLRRESDPSGHQEVVIEGTWRHVNGPKDTGRFQLRGRSLADPGLHGWWSEDAANHDEETGTDHQTWAWIQQAGTVVAGAVADGFVGYPPPKRFSKMRRSNTLNSNSSMGSVSSVGS